MIPDEETALIRQAMEAAKKTPEGMDFPILGSEKKFPINLYCNDSLEPSTSANNRSVYTRWMRNGTGLVNLYVNGEALKVLEDELRVIQQEKSDLDGVRSDLDTRAEKWKTEGLVKLENL